MLKHGDGLLAIEAVVNSPVGLTLDSQGYLYICERGENKIRRAEVIVGNNLVTPSFPHADVVHILTRRHSPGYCAGE